MRLARPTFPDEHHRLRSVDVAALGQLGDLRRRDHRCLGEVELLQALHLRQMGILYPPNDGVLFPLLDLRLQQRLQVTEVTFDARARPHLPALDTLRRPSAGGAACSAASRRSPASALMSGSSCPPT